MKTTRIQRSRRKGWRLPAGAVCVSRPSPFGNPFCAQDYPDQPRQFLVDCFRLWLMFDDDGKKLADWARKELRGKALCCWCPLNLSCHADVLVEAAEGRLWSNWRLEPEHLISARSVGNRWIATVYEKPARSVRNRQPDWIDGRKVPMAIDLYPGIGVLGEYQTRQQAFDAALAQIAMRDEKRLCTPAEIDRVRKENRARERQLELT